MIELEKAKAALEVSMKQEMDRLRTDMTFQVIRAEERTSILTDWFSAT